MAGRQYQAQQQKRQSDAAALTASMGPRGGDIHPPLPSVSIGDRIADVLGSAVGQATTRSGVVEGWDAPPPTIVSDDFQAQRAALRNLPPQDDIYGLPNVVSDRERQARSALTIGNRYLHGEPVGKRLGENVFTFQDYPESFVLGDQAVPEVVEGQPVNVDTSYDWMNFGIDPNKDSTPEALLAQELDVSLYPDGVYDPAALNKATAGEEAYRLFREQRQLDQIAAKRQGIQDQVVRDTLDQGETTLSADWDRLITAGDTSQYPSQAPSLDEILPTEPRTIPPEVIGESTNPALDFWMDRGDQTLQEAADALEARQVGDEESLRADVDEGFDEILNAWKALRTPDQTAESDAAQVVLISLEGDTSEAAETVKKQAKKAVKSFKGTDIRDRVAEETITSELGPPDFYDDRFHVPTMVQDLAADVVTGPSEEPPYWTKEIFPESTYLGSERQIANTAAWQAQLDERRAREAAERHQALVDQGFVAPLTGAGEYPEVSDPRFDMFTPGQDRGMVDPDQAYDPALVRFGVQGPVTPGDPVEDPYWANEFPPDALPFPDQNTWKEGYFPPNLHEDWPARGAYPVGPQDPTAAPVFPTQVGEDVDPILPQDLNPPLGEFGLDKPGAADFLGVEEEEVVTEEALPVEEEIIEPTWKDDYVPPIQTGGDAGEFEGLWDVPPAEADAPITPEMIEQGPWQKTQMGFFAKDYRPSDLELDDQGQPITRPAGFFGDPVPPVSVTPPPWLNPDDEAALEADVAREDVEEVVDVTAAAEEEQVDLDEDAEVAAVIDDEEVEVEEPVVVDTELEVQRSIEMLDAYLSAPEKIRQKEFIKSLVGDDVYARVISLEYSDDDIKKFYDELKDFKKKIQESDRKHNTNLWNMIESIYRIVVKGELG